MDIGSGKGYPASHLSNFHPYVFKVYIDELPNKLKDAITENILPLLDKDNDNRLYIEYNSMEGFLQGMKRNKAPIQLSIAKEIGLKAKRRGSKGNRSWKSTQTLWFLGVPMKRKGDLYQEVLDVGFKSLFKNEKFKKALAASGKSVLTHSIGKTKKSETVLTIREFCSRLTKLRDNKKL